MAVPLQHLDAKVSADQVCRLPEDSESFRSAGREQGRAVSFSHADMVTVHRERHQLEAFRGESLKKRGLSGGQLHARTGQQDGSRWDNFSRLPDQHAQQIQAAEEEIEPDSSCRKTSRSAAASSWSPTWLLRN